jgi:AcrR family transcriptional regulator
MSSQIETEKYPLRTQRKAATRRRIVNSALRLAGKTGAAKVTMADVAKEADVHVTTLFTHFSSKAELFSGISGPAIAALEERIAECKGRIPFFEFIRSIQEEFTTRMSSRGRETVESALYLRTQVELLPAWIDYEKTQVSLLADYIRHDFDVSKIDSTLFAGMIVSSNINSFDLWLSDPESNDLTTLSRVNLEHIERIFRSACEPVGDID